MTTKQADAEKLQINTQYPTFDDKAVFTDNAQVLKLKLKLGANPNYIHNGVSSKKRTPLLHAISSNYKNVDKIVKILLKDKRTNVNAVDTNKDTALILTSRYLSGEKCIKVLKLLLSHSKININAVNLLGYTALYQFIFMNNIPAVKLLVQQPELDPNLPPNTNNSSALHLAILNNNYDIVCILLNLDTLDINLFSVNETPYQRAERLAYDKNTQNKTQAKNILLKLAGDKRFNPNKRDKNDKFPLYNSVERNDIEVVKILLKHPKTDPNLLYKQDTCLHLTHYKGYKSIAMELLKHSDTNPAIPNKSGQMFINLTTDVDILEILVEEEDTD